MLRTRTSAVGVLILFTVQTACSVINSNQDVTRRDLFGITLSSSATKLVNQVEQLYKKPIHERIAQDLQPDTFGSADTGKDGTPIISINPQIGRTEENIVHELFHLKMQAEGYPLFDFDGSPEIMQNNLHDFYQLRQKIYDPMSHRIFFPEMKRMGLAPDAHIRSQYIKNRTSNENPSEDSLALYYYRLVLELDDQNTVSELVQWYKGKGWNRALEKGRGLVKIISESNPRTPSEMIAAFVQCANHLVNGYVEFSVLRVEERKYADTSKHYAIVLVKNLP